MGRTIEEKDEDMLHIETANFASDSFQSDQTMSNAGTVGDVPKPDGNGVGL